MRRVCVCVIIGKKNDANGCIKRTVFFIYSASTFAVVRRLNVRLEILPSMFRRQHRILYVASKRNKNSIFGRRVRPAWHPSRVMIEVMILACVSYIVTPSSCWAFEMKFVLVWEKLLKYWKKVEILMKSSADDRTIDWIFRLSAHHNFLCN